jgi:chromosome segregation ATPase
MADDDSARLSIVQRQKTWDAKFEDVEKKESELMTTQWGMMREQLRSLTTDLAKAQVEIEALKKANAQMTVMFKKQLQDTDDELEKEKVSRAAGDDNLQKQIDELKKSLAEEDKKTQSELEKLREWTKGKVDPLEKGLADTNRKVADANKDIEKLKTDVDHLEKKIDPLLDAIKKEGENRKALEDDLRKALKDLEDALKNAMKDREVAVDAQLKAIKAALEKEKVDRDAGDKNLSDLLKKLQKVVEPYADELKDLANKIRELENTVHPRLNEHKKALDKSDADRVSGHNNLAQKLADLTKKLESEVAARAALQDDMEQMLEALRSKLRSLIQEQINAVNNKMDALGHALHDELDQEKADRAAGDSALEKEIEALKKGLDDKLKKALDELKALEDKLRDEIVELEKKAEAALGSRVEDLAKQIQIIKEGLLAFITEEETTDEQIVTTDEANMDMLGKLFKDVGDRFLQQHSAPRRKTTISKRTCKTILTALTALPALEEQQKGE